MTARPPKNITIVGVGLLGGSLGLRLKTVRPSLEVTGYARRREKLELAVKRGAIDRIADSLEEAVKEADVVVLCTPVKSIVSLIKEMSPFLKPGAIVTDVGSTKSEIVKQAEEAVPAQCSFVGSHPMAGSEKKGIEAANPNLFEQAVVVLTPTQRTDSAALETVKAMWGMTGAIVTEISPEDHDRLAATVSHLPHMVASALVNTVGRRNEQDPRTASMAAGGFRDTTRIAGSDPKLWREICEHNSACVLDLMDDFIGDVQEIRGCIAEKNFEALEELLRKGKTTLEALPLKGKGILPARYDVTVEVSDRPGALAEITRLLSVEKINIVDIMVTHVRMAEKEAPIRIGLADDKGRERALAVLRKSGFKAVAV